MAALPKSPWDAFPGLFEPVRDRLANPDWIGVTELDAKGRTALLTMQKTEYLEVTVTLRIRRQDLQK